MHVVAPLYLLLLVPWLGLAAWLLWGRRPMADVPFVELWRGPVAGAPIRRAAHVPPLAIVLALLAILLAIVAAAGPTIAARAADPGERQRITVIVDRGLTMSAPARLERLAEAAAPPVLDAFGRGPARFVAVPGGAIQEGERSDLSDVASAFPPTAADTREELSAAVARALAAGDDPVIVLSDQLLTVPPSDRLIHITPDTTLDDSAIVHVAARARPRPQVMVRLRRTADRPAEAPLTITTAGAMTSSHAVFAGGAKEIDVFVDVTSLGPTVQVALDLADDLAANDRAWLVRESAWPRLEPRAVLSRELERMVEAYRNQRPAGDGSRAVAIVGDQDAAGTDQAAVVVVAPPAAAATTTPAGGAIHVADHPIARDVDWRDVLAEARVSTAPGGWTSIVTVGDRAAIAVRESPARQVWVGLDAAAFARSPAYVVFWTNVFDWVGEGGDAFEAETVGPLGPEWRRLDDGAAPRATPNGMWPGLYQRDDGAIRALNAPPVHVTPPPQTDWRDRLDHVSRAGGAGRTLAGPVLLAAMGCAVLAAVWWPARRVRRGEPEQAGAGP